MRLVDRVDGLLARRLPPSLRQPARRALFLPLDLWERFSGRRPPGVPPRGLRFVGAGDYLGNARELLRYLDLAAWDEESVILDVGCGTGRAALPLLGRLAGGRYEGFDVSRSAVHWCRRELGRRDDRLHFRHVDVRSAEYNPRGAVEADAFRFPYDDATFDVVLAASVFTHLLTAAAARYVTETARVLRTGGLAVATFFLLDRESAAAIASGRAHYRFAHRLGAARVESERHPEAAVAYPEELLRAHLSASGLEVVEPIRRGAWTGRPDGWSYQDVVLARRP